MKLPRSLRDRRHVRLLRHARGGDTEAFRCLYRELYEPVSRYVEARVQRDEAEDLISVVFHRFLERLDDFDPQKGSPLGWLLTIAHHAVVDHYRTRRETLGVEDLADALAGSDPSPMDGLLLEESIRAAREILRKLPMETRQMFELRFDQELTYRDIAGVLGISEMAVKQRFSRELRRLREQLRAGARAREVHDVLE